MKLFQYWDTGVPPEDVAACIQSVRDVNPEFEHCLYDCDRASWFIAKRLGVRHRDAFLALAVPAMQADYFRLCALWERAGVYVDADSTAMRPLRTLLAVAPGGYITMWNRMLQNHVLAIPSPGNPFIGAVLELATRNIEARLQDRAFEVTGPALFNQIWMAVDLEGAHEDEHLRRNPDLALTSAAEAVAALYPGAGEALASMERRHEMFTEQWLRRVEELSYRDSPSEWQTWKGPIYREA